MQQELRRLATCAHKKQQTGQGHGVPVIAKGHYRFTGKRRHAGKNRLKTHGTGQLKHQENAQSKAKVANTIDHKGLHRSRIGRWFLEPETNQQIRGQTHTFPAEEHLHQIVRRHQHQHGECEERQIGKETRAARILVHIADRIEVHERRHAIDHDQHHGGQCVNAKGPIHLQRTGGEPVGHLNPQNLMTITHLHKGHPGQKR